MDKNTALIILQYNNYEDTINCIDSVIKFNTAPIKIIVVDNGSKRENVVERTDVLLRKKFGYDYSLLYDTSVAKGELSTITFVVSPINSGYADGNNKGLKFAYADSTINKIMILNNDVLFVEDIIPTLSKNIEDTLDCAIVSPILYTRNLEKIDYNCARVHSTVWEEIYYNLFNVICYNIVFKHLSKNRFLLKKNDERVFMPIELPSGSCMLINKDYFKKIGSFDSHTFLYWEENILYEKVKKTGKQNYINKACKCIHLGAQSTNSSQTNWFTFMCTVKSSNYFMKEYSDCNMLEYSLFKVSLSFNIIMTKIKMIIKKML